MSEIFVNFKTSSVTEMHKAMHFEYVTEINCGKSQTT